MSTRASRTGWILPLALTLALTLSGAATAQQEPFPRKTPPPRAAGRGEETALGFIIKAELRLSAQITFPAAPTQPKDIPHNGPIARNKGMALLILHFELQHGHCVPLSRDTVLVKDGNDKTYSYGGWWVDQAKYTLCGRPDFARPIIGPWVNTFWDPTTIRPELEQFDLVYEIDPAAKKLTFTDGKVVVDLDVLLKR
jgi:hypothetical protein